MRVSTSLTARPVKGIEIPVWAARSASTLYSVPSHPHVGVDETRRNVMGLGRLSEFGNYVFYCGCFPRSGFAIDEEVGGP